MITQIGCRTRRERLLSRLPDGCMAGLVASPEAIAYVSGFAPSPFTFRTAHARSLALVRDGATTLFVDSVLAPMAAEAFADQIVKVHWYDGKSPAGLRGSGLGDAVADALRSSRIERLAAESLALPLAVARAIEAAVPGVAMVALDELLLALRRTKDDDEIATLRLSIKAAEAGHAAALEAIRPGMTELELFQVVERACRDSVGAPVLVYGDFAAGPRARGPITLPTQRPMEQGELLVLDFSVIIGGYRCDFANTLAVGEPTPRQVETFEACLAALEAGEVLLKPGVAARDVDAAVRSAYAARGFDPKHASHTGHGLGLAHPEAPFLVEGSDEVLAPGDVVTIEPSQHVPGEASVRIEHNYLITSTAYERLTHHRIALR